MMAYFFCIGWTTLFVFLAERQFKRLPVEKYRKRYFGRLLNGREAQKTYPNIEKHIGSVKPEISKLMNSSSSEVKHINVRLEGDDEVTIVIPNIAFKSSALKQKKNTKIQDVQRMRGDIIENNFHLGDDLVSIKRRAEKRHGIKNEFTDNIKYSKDDNHDIAKNTEPTYNMLKRKIDSKRVVDIITAKKQKNGGAIVERILPKKEEMPSKLVNISKRADSAKIPKNKRHIVGDEIFREKKINNIVKSTQQQKSNRREKNIDGISRHRKVHKIDSSDAQDDGAKN